MAADLVWTTISADIETAPGTGGFYTIEEKQYRGKNFFDVGFTADSSDDVPPIKWLSEDFQDNNDFNNRNKARTFAQADHDLRTDPAPVTSTDPALTEVETIYATHGWYVIGETKNKKFYALYLSLIETDAFVVISGERRAVVDAAIQDHNAGLGGVVLSMPVQSPLLENNTKSKGKNK